MIIRLLIVEDQPALRRILHLRLAAEEDIYVIGEAFNCETAIELTSSLCPDIVLVDVDIQGVDGMGIVWELHRLCPQTAVIVLSIQDDAQIRERVASIGAVTLVGKSLPTDFLLATIRDVAARQNPN
jgi:two-component system, NarL family, response regulator NreC